MRRGYDDYDPQSRYYDREDRRRHLEAENSYWHSPAGQYHLQYNENRKEEIKRRNAEVMRNLTKTYYSGKIIVILIVTVVLSIFTLPLALFVQAVIMWNILIFTFIMGFFYATAKTKVRPEVKNRENMIRLSAHEKAFRK